MLLMATVSLSISYGFGADQKDLGNGKHNQLAYGK